MLILSRRESECVCLGDDIVLTIVAVGNDKIRIGVQAPAGVRILRMELDPATLPFNPPPLAQAIEITQKPPSEDHRAAPLSVIVANAASRKSDEKRRAA